MQTNNETITPSPRITPVLIHVPHSSTYIPSEEWQHFVTPKLAIEIIGYTNRLYSCGKSNSVNILVEEIKGLLRQSFYYYNPVSVL